MQEIWLWSPLTFSSAQELYKLQAAILKSCKLDCHDDGWSCSFPSQSCWELVLLFPLPVFHSTRACFGWVVGYEDASQLPTNLCLSHSGAWFGLLPTSSWMGQWRGKQGSGKTGNHSEIPKSHSNTLSFSTCWTQNIRLLRSWDLSSNKIQFCVSDEKKINYFIPYLWREENKSWLYSWKSFESAWSDLVENWRLTDKSNYLFFFFLVICLSCGRLSFLSSEFPNLLESYFIILMKLPQSQRDLHN